MRDDEPKPRVLLVDDNRENVRLLSQALHRQGYTEVAVAYDAAEALAEFARQVPDALVMDLGLPPIEGHSLLYHVRRSTRGSDVPVLLLSGRQPPEAIRGAAQEGVSGFIQQPFDAREITFKIEQAVRGVTLRTAELADLLADDDRADDDPEPRERAPAAPGPARRVTRARS